MKSLGVKRFILAGAAILCSSLVVNSGTLIPANLTFAVGFGFIIYGVLRLIKEKQDTRQQ